MNETELLFTHVLNCDRASLYLDKERALNKDEVLFISAALKRRIRGEPIAYILGKQEFMGLDFKVNKDVLIPRQETEILVESAIKAAGTLKLSRSGPLKILDVGTGSGCIAISLAKFLPREEISAVDVSEKALAVALENAKLHDARVKFINSDLFVRCPTPEARYDIIVSNPPYIPSLEIEKLQPEVRYEPRAALDGGNDGLDFYRRIIKSAGEYLKDNGLLIMEMGFGQKDAVKNILQKSGNFEIIDMVKDYSDIERVIIGKNHG
ncbi:MAG: peptide chain release factor N(5)-glutamine methyltransferase [Candidatus Omnitrophica bacterium]|nr:peptide chain release factor N(5)-glutamine methyltransferase [Candidatus Omnitrophota bacterium]